MNSPTPTPSESSNPKVVLGHLAGWPLFLFGLFPLVLPMYGVIRENIVQGEALTEANFGFAAMGTAAFGVISGIGLILICLAAGVRSKLGQVLIWTYGILLFSGIVVATAGSS